MLNSSYDGEIEQWDMIDKYSMNVIYTASVDIRRRMSAKKRSFDFVEFDTDLVGEQDIYSSEYVISDNSGHCCNVKNEWLYEAMLFLDDKLKEVLILKYWYLLSRRDIAKILNVSEKTITNWKNKAFKLIKNYKERRLIFVDLKNRTAEKAINGDCDAQILMLKRYERYINKVSMVTKKDRFGNLIRYVDEDFKAEIQMRYLEELLKCKVIKNDNNTK